MKLKIIIFLFFISTSVYSNEIKILNDIPGQGNKIKNHDKITVNYRGTLLNGIEFDSSFKRNAPFTFQIGIRQVIEGWDKGLIGMKLGGKRTLRIPPNLAYGSKKIGDKIPANSTLIFEIEILEINPPGYKNIKSSDLIDRQKKGFILVDIRSNEERIVTGIINGSFKITAFDLNGNFDPHFMKQYHSITKKNDHVIFVSNTGEVSSILANGLTEQLSMKNIYSLEGGIKKWIKEKRFLLK